MNLPFKVWQDTAVLDEQRKYIERFPEHKYIGAEIIGVQDMESGKIIKIKVYVYKIHPSRIINNEIPFGCWIRIHKPVEMWKRVDTEISIGRNV